jgi:adenylyl-sulfate kinase
MTSVGALSVVPNPRTIWFTGLPGSGKSTLAGAVKTALGRRGQASVVLDGDLVRSGLSSDLGFSREDRSENARRIAEVAALFNLAGVHVLVALISPRRSDRAMARRIVGPAFIEVYMSTPVEVCEKRDPKGLYRAARTGAIKDFTGVSAEYEAPDNAHLSIDTSAVEMQDAVERILSLSDA